MNVDTRFPVFVITLSREVAEAASKARVQQRTARTRLIMRTEKIQVPDTDGSLDHSVF